MTKAELLRELDVLRRRVAQLKQTEPKKTAKEVEESEQTFRTIFDNAADGIALADVDNKKFYIANKVFRQSLGYNSQEIKNLGVMSIYPEEDLPYVLEQFEKQVRREFTLAKNIPVRRKDGRVFYADINSFLIKLAGKTYLMSIFRDVTGRKKAEEEVKKFKTLANRAGYGVGISDLEGNLTYVNESFAQMHGYKVDELIGTNLSIFHKEEQMENVNRLNKQLIEKGSFVSEEVWHSRKDGTIFCALMNGTLIRDDKGQPQFLSCTVLDITERKQVDEKVLESEEKYRGLTESLSELVYRAEPKMFAATYVNNAVERFYGYSAEEWLRDPSLWENLIHPDDKERVLKEFEETKRKLKSGVIKYRIINKNKTVRWVEDRVSWEKDQQGKVISMNGVMRDITEHQKTEEKQTLRFEISKIFHQQKSLKNICKKIVSLIKEHLDCEVVALRMKEGDDYPYFVNNGFSQKFIKSENYLCIHDEKGDCLRDSRGHPVLACMCGIVINAKFNQDKPFFTKEGSFWTNSTSDLLASTTTEDRGETTRNVCNQNGYESVALIPIKVNDDNIGLLQINDKRRNRFSSGDIQFLEKLGYIIGISIEHIKVEEALRESKESLAIAQRVACIGSWDWNIQDNTATWSDETYRQFGFKPNEITPTYETFVGFVHRDDRERVNQAVKQAFDEQKSYSIDVRMIHVDGTEWIMHAQGAVQRNKNGKAVKFIGTQQDITARKKAEEGLARLAKFPAENPNPVLRVAKDGTIIYANKASQPLLRQWRREIGQRLPAKWRQLASEAFSSDSAKEVEVEYKCCTLSLTFAPVVDFGYVNIYSLDITDRKKAQEALQESEERLRVALSAAQMGTWRWDSVTNQDTRDASLNRILGLEAIASTQPVEDFLHFVHPEDRDMVEEKIQRAVRERRTYMAEFRIIRPDSTVRWLRDQGKPLCDENDRVLCLTGAVIDITELKQAQEEISKYREKMVQTEELATVGTLSATLAHELTQPLTVIRLSIQNSLAELETMSCPGTVVEYLKEGLSGVSSMTLMVDRFRNFARMSTKRTVSEVDFNAVAERIVNLLDEGAWRAKVTLQVEGMDKLPIIHSYERDLEQLFFSLVENAIQAADGKKKRRVIISGAVRDDEHIELQFSDNCGGIAPENLDRIFEPFFTTKHAGERTGLGLCVVERIVSQLDGKIRIESKLGKGSTFFVTLPTNRGKR